MKCYDVLVNCMENTMEDDRYNLTLERSKVWHGKFIGIHKGRCLGLGWIAHSRESINEKVETEAMVPVGTFISETELRHTPILCQVHPNHTRIPTM